MIKNLASNLVLEEVLNPEQLQAFLLFPFKLYKGTAWVPPLINEQERFFFSANPFWRHAEKVLYLAYTDKRQVVGRIAGFVNQRYLSFSNKKTGHFGFFVGKRKITLVNKTSYSTNYLAFIIVCKIEHFFSVPPEGIC